MKEITIYCDGACSGNPGPGGWGTILFYNQHQKELSGFSPHTTNNRMEIQACIEGLQALTEPCRVRVYSDSAYLCNAVNRHWLESWQRNQWRKADKKPVENVELWKKLCMLMQTHQVTFHKVKGHADNEWNNRADQLATQQIKRNRENLR